MQDKLEIFFFFFIEKTGKNFYNHKNYNIVLCYFGPRRFKAGAYN